MNYSKRLFLNYQPFYCKRIWWIMAKVRTRKRGKSYSYVFEAGKTSNGKRRVIEKGGFTSKENAYLAGLQAFTDYKHGNVGITNEHITVKELINNWLENVAKTNVRESTYNNYRNILNHRVIPYLGDELVQDLKRAHINSLLKNLFNLGLSHGTIHQVKTIFNLVLDYAVYTVNLIEINPARGVKVPKLAKKNCVLRSVISQSQLDDLLKERKDLYIPLVLMYCSGMRVGEVLGLTWDNITHNSIIVNKQYSIITTKLTNPKTKSSIREIPISSDVLNILKSWRVRQIENENKYGKSYIYQYENMNKHIVEYSKSFKVNDNLKRKYFVCTKETGKLIQYSSIRYFLSAHKLNAHSFRHTHATLLIENGASLKGVAARLGHTNISTTQDIYTHVTEKMKLDTLATFNTIFHADNTLLQTERRHFFPFFFI